ncbi:hypothetical protein EI94DRAFT_1811810 [Lactarius quietus]|nr:hypothetical protein EI94DRAFT_1811810 [Lactarius quietus]
MDTDASPVLGFAGVSGIIRTDYVLRSDPTPTHRQRKCLHEHWKNCHDYPEVHTWEARDQKDIEEEEAVRALVAAEDDSYLAFDKACRVRQLALPLVTNFKLGGIRGPSWLFALYKSYKSFLSSEAMRFAQRGNKEDPSDPSRINV